MNLIINQMMQLQNVHVADGNWLREWFTSAAVEQRCLTIRANQLVAVAVCESGGKQALQSFWANAVEYWGCNRSARIAMLSTLRHVLLPSCFQIWIQVNIPASVSNPTQVKLEHLAQVHSRRHTQRVEHDVNWSTVSQERHIFFWKNAGNNTLVAVAAGKLIALRNLTVLSDVDANHLVHAVWKLVAVVFSVFASDFLNCNHGTGFAVWHAERSIAHFAALFAEDCAEQTLFWSEFGLTLWRYLTNQNVASFNFSTDANDTAFVEVCNRVFTNVWQVASNLFGTKFGFASVDFVFFNMNGRKRIVLHETLGNNNSILVVVTVPRHERNEQILTQRKLTLFGCRTVSKHRASFNALAVFNKRHLVVAGGLVGTLELGKLVAGLGSVVVHNANNIGRNVGYDARLFS